MKVYTLETIGFEHTVPVEKDGTNVYIKFTKLSLRSPFGVFHTDDKDLQKAIENSKLFQSGVINLEGGVSEGALKQAEAVETAESESGKNIVDTEDNVDAGAGEGTTDTEDNGDTVTDTTATEATDDIEDNGDTVTDTTAAEATKDTEDNGDTVADTTAAEEAGEVPSEPKVYALVKTLQDAKAVLISDFGVKPNALAKPANIRKKIAELGVEFPNLPTDEA